ncbi:Lar family restriction alleviation protein [Sulfitobacter sp. 20_GPM-1509m]|uniref:Lar family restriction alleviation protein n=1 Tax=Sulfitobacter sp. 20_GPM-1509m TaxID=1380367 RepID=UPI001C2FE4F6|nr:Lar family restriction alleviation protein [Sulfitobacter sp. 20_GPM-1509m]
MTTKKKENLLSCPFCRGFAIVVDCEANNDFTVRCFDCGVETRHGPKQEVISLWNRRKSIEENLRELFAGYSHETGEGGGETIVIDAPEMRCAECDCENGGDDCNWIAPQTKNPAAQ